MEVLQIFLTLIIGIVAIILTVAGVQLIIVLQDVKILLKRINLVIGELGFFSSIKNIFSLVNFLVKKIKKDDKQ